MKDEKLVSPTQMDLMNLLSCYRGCTAKQLAKMHYDIAEVTKSNVSYMHAQLNVLEEYNLVTFFKPHPRVSKYSIYHLSRLGLERFLRHQQVEEGYKGEGWVSAATDYGYFDYEVYEPPKNQVQHHSLLIDMFTILLRLNVQHRNNLYAKRELVDRQHRTMLRPDGEMVIRNENYMIEIDKGTESHAQLIEKFKNYYNYCTEYYSHFGNYDVKSIVFIVNGAHGGHLQRRWNNVLAAYYKAMGELHDKITLYLVLESEFEKFVTIETNKTVLNEGLLQKVCGTRYTPIETAAAGTVQYSTIVDEQQAEYKIFYQVASTPYSTRNLHTALKMLTCRNNYFSKDGYEIYLSDNLKAYNVNQEILKLYEQAREYKIKLV